MGKRRPGLPKRPMSAFLMWLKNARNDIKAQHPHMRATQIAKKGGEIWRRMRTKKIWERRAYQARCRYYRAVAAYESRHGKKNPHRGRKRMNRKSSYPVSEPIIKHTEDTEQTKEEDIKSVCNCS